MRAALPLLGLALLITIVSIAVMSIPGPLRRFEGWPPAKPPTA